MAAGRGGKLGCIVNADQNVNHFRFLEEQLEDFDWL
jgi:hypothetical protein